MPSTTIGLIDVGFVRASLASAQGREGPRVRLDASAVVQLMQSVAADVSRGGGGDVLRSYWYDGQYLPGDPRHHSQLPYLEAVGLVPGLQLRLGQLVERAPAWQGDLKRVLDEMGVDRADFERRFTFAPEVRQKGVDTLMALDLVLLAQRGAYDTAVLFSGDQDLCEAVRVAQEFGRRVVLVVPPSRGVSLAMRMLADEVVELSMEQVLGLRLADRERACSE